MCIRDSNNNLANNNFNNIGNVLPLNAIGQANHPHNIFNAGEHSLLKTNMALAPIIQHQKFASIDATGQRIVITGKPGHSRALSLPKPPKINAVLIVDDTPFNIDCLLYTSPSPRDQA
eukprot:TRINITY_DN18425_c0_g1_i1.p1 TRINITY_DN18425_c0_g1~~TRINITY_DN18425_c0_g1_i1.p1  ORF type:complete len:118 (+),score=25.01 TRINITY_DN18425_c0_g1_i1:64-417(+)